MSDTQLARDLKALVRTSGERRNAGPRVRLRLWPTGRNSCICGHRVLPNDEGFYEGVFLVSDLPNVRRHVEDEWDGEIKSAKETHARLKAQFEREEPGKVYGGSVEAEIYRRLGRGIRKLRKPPEVLEQLPEVSDPEEVREERFVAALAKGLTQAMQTVVAPAAPAQAAAKPPQKGTKS